MEKPVYHPTSDFPVSAVKECTKRHNNGLLVFDTQLKKMRPLVSKMDRISNFCCRAWLWPSLWMGKSHYYIFWTCLCVLATKQTQCRREPFCPPNLQRYIASCECIYILAATASDIEHSAWMNRTRILFIPAPDTGYYICILAPNCNPNPTKATQRLERKS